MGKRKEAVMPRRHAEERLAEPFSLRDGGAGPVTRRQVTDRRVHAFELQMQKEELRAARLEIEQLLERYTEIFDFAPNGIFRLALDGSIRACNFAGARLLGLPRDEVVGARFERFLCPRDQPEFRSFFASVLARPGEAEPAPHARELAFRQAGDLVGRVTGALLDRGGALSALLAVEDVTARRRAEDALRDDSRKKDDFLAALSHELRNPLAPIRNALSLYRIVPRESERAAAAVAIVDRQVAHLTRIVDDLMDVTRIARGKIQVRPERIDLADVVRRTVEDYRSGFLEKGVRLERETDPGPCWVQGDASRLAQVLGNLLANALEFTDGGGRVDVTLRCESGCAVLRVRDTGIGIPEGVRERVFEPFVQGEQTLARPHGGLGLGLATVKAIVELHGGSVGVASEGPRRGAELTVRLPLADARATGAASEGTRPPLRVLVVEDNPEAADSLKDLLEALGHQVRVAPGGSIGILTAQRFRPDVVLCDLGLPGLSGYDVARALRSHEELKGAVLVALSGYARPEDVARAADAGFDRHVAKPATLDALEKILGEASGNRPGPRAGE